MFYRSVYPQQIDCERMEQKRVPYQSYFEKHWSRRDALGGHFSLALWTPGPMGRSINGRGLVGVLQSMIESQKSRSMCCIDYGH